MKRALDYMELRPGMAIQGIPLDAAFLGSCTNARLSDLRQAADYLRDRKTATIDKLNTPRLLNVAGNPGISPTFERMMTAVADRCGNSEPEASFISFTRSKRFISVSHFVGG